MVDQALQYKSLLNKVNIIINNVSKLGMDVEKYKKTLEDIINEVESSTAVSKSKPKSCSGMMLVCDYTTGIKKLMALEFELKDYELYFKALNICELVSMKLNKSDILERKEDIKSYVNEIIKVLRAIKFSSTSYYGNKRKIVERIYGIAYKLIQLEIVLFGNSEIYDYINSDDTDIFFIDECVRKDVEKLDMEDDKNKKIKEKIYDISSKGLDTSYFDIELIKLLIAREDNFNADNVLSQLDNLRKEMNGNVWECKKLTNSYQNLLNDLHVDKTLVKKYKNRIIGRIVSIVLSASIIGGAFVGGNLLSKKIASKDAHPKMTTTYSKEYGKKTENSYSFVEDKEQDKNYLKVYTDWRDSIWNGITRDVYAYDVSDIKLDTIEEYLDLNYENLDYEKDTISGDDNNQEILLQRGYTEVEQILIDRDKVETIVNFDEYMGSLILIYSLLIVVTLGIEYISCKKEEENNFVGVITNLYYLKKYDIYEYRDNKFKYSEKLSECKKVLNDLLAEINKHDELKRKFDELYKANIYLLDNPNELLAKVESLSQDLSKEEIEGKIRSLKRF